ncbi:MAG: putative sulfate exporter family transporter [Pseudomonadota bacterium]
MINKPSPRKDSANLYAADLYGELQLSEQAQHKNAASVLPGLVLVGIAALAALWLSEHYGFPVILMGLFIGLALNFVHSQPKLSTGLDFASQTLLRCGIVLIGLRVTIGGIIGLGIAPFLAIICIMACVIAAGLLSAKLFKQSVYLGLLTGGATAICGISAALAMWGLIGKHRVEQAQFTLVVLGVTLSSAFAMTFYPIIASSMGLTDQQAGFVLGASIHDVAQAIGGGFSFSAAAGETATVVKLSRVALLAPVLILTAVGLNLWGGDSQSGALARPTLKQAVPWFIAGFVCVVALNTALEIPPPIIEIGSAASKGCLLMAVIAAAIKSNLAGLLAHGWQSFGPIVLTSLTALGLSVIAATLL